MPELTAAQISGKKEQISHTISVLLRKSLALSLFIGLMLFILSETLGKAIYKSEDAGYYIRIFSLLVPLMYMDIVTDGCLKGLGQHLYSMSFNIIEAFIGVILVYALLPKFALNGYIGIIFFEEIFNFSLSFWRLSRVTEIRIFPVSQNKKCRE